MKLATLALCLLTLPAAAQTAVDGDTIKLAGTTYRLWGIDAAESHQSCADGWPAGTAATGALIDLMRGHAITCEARGKDRYGRTIGLCRADGVDLSAGMVRAGQAVAFTRYSHDYVTLEAEARAARVGVHAHVGCTLPSEYRAQRRQ